MLGLGSAVGVLLSAFAYTGGLRGPKKDDDTDEVAAKWEEMHRYRSSWEETVEELGEGRGNSLLLLMHLSS